jgi:hypothetical protein
LVRFLGLNWYFHQLTRLRSGRHPRGSSIWTFATTILFLCLNNILGLFGLTAFFPSGGYFFNCSTIVFTLRFLTLFVAWSLRLFRGQDFRWAFRTFFWFFSGLLFRHKHLTYVWFHENKLHFFSVKLRIGSVSNGVIIFYSRLVQLYQVYELNPTFFDFEFFDNDFLLKTIGEYFLAHLL